jgi:hypothetical protein
VLQHTPSGLGLLAGLSVANQNSGEALRALDEALARVNRFEERWFEAEQSVYLRLSDQGEPHRGLSGQRACCS